MYIYIHIYFALPGCQAARKIVAGGWPSTADAQTCLPAFGGKEAPETRGQVND